ncbi:multiheme c-type cytochrome [Ferrimonas pelagia]|uniref:Decaheme c-type cytochrome OmcA n=1 Tax=Ferrimonas pelagia TaxID=1177826 RepID=A0ABP9ERK4_9GAMM
MIVKNNNWKVLATAAAVSAMLAGCSDGKDGSDGIDGAPGDITIDITRASAINSTFGAVAYDSASNVLSAEFSLSDNLGVAISGVQMSDISTQKFGRIGVVSELPEDPDAPENEKDVDREIWLSYHNQADTNKGRISACSDDNCTLEATDVAGTYVLTINDAITAEADREDNILYFDYDATQPHGLMLRIKGADFNTYHNHYFTETSAVERPKTVVTDETCQACHKPEQEEGTYRFASNSHYGLELETCIHCHTDYSQSSSTTATGDWSIKGLVHHIHTTRTTADFQDVAKFDNVIWQGDKGAIDDGLYPQSAANCNACHTPAFGDETVADDSGLTVHALDWFKDVDNTCIDCHDYHKPADNCIACHNDDVRHSGEDPTRNGIGGASRHFAGLNLANHSQARAIEAGKLIEVSYNGIEVIGNEIVGNVELSYLGEPVSLDQLSSTTVYLNAISNEAPDMFVNYRVQTPLVEIQGEAGQFTFNAIDSEDKTDVAKLAALLNDNHTLAISTYVNACFGNKKDALQVCTDSSVQSPNVHLVEYFNLQGEDVVERVSAANYESCLACHNEDMAVRSGGSLHYRNGDLASCAQCHEGDTDYNALSVRIHGTFGKAHGQPMIDGNRERDFFSSQQCTACHLEGDYELSNARQSVIRWDREKNSDNNFSSPQAGVCASCHTNADLFGESQAETAANHIAKEGGVIGAETYEEAADANETCMVCHTGNNIRKNHKF